MNRREGLSKLSGRERYVDDLPLPGALWGATVRSPAPRGHLREIRFGEGVDWTEVVVVDARAIPGKNVVALIAEDQPVLADGVVRHVHEPVLLLAHASREVVRRAAAAVTVVVDPEPAVFDFRRDPTPAEVQHGADNVFKHIRIDKGDVAAAFSAAPHVIEGVYETGSQEHVYLETQGMAAWVEDGRVVVEGSMQCPFYVHEALKLALGRDDAGVRVIQAPTGGGFGGKEEFPSGVAIHAALLALAAGRPVKLIYDRAEDLAVTTKRHPSWVRYKTAVSRDGRLLAQEVEVRLDAGAYVTLSPVVLSRAVIHAGGPYRCPNVAIDGKAMLTNAVPFGAFRGFGAPQTIFACERHMDRIAAELGLDPARVRQVNLLEDGDSTATGQVIRDGVDRREVLERALGLSSFYLKRRAHVSFNSSHETLRRGVGFATFWHGAGFTGGGEAHLASVVRVAGLAGGKVEVLAASTEMGQGTTTIFTQLAAGRLGLDPDDVLVATPDTARVPDSGPTVASRTAMIVGHLVERACDDLCRRLGLPDEPAGAARGEAFQRALVTWHADHPGQALVGEAQYEAPPGIVWDQERYRGDAYGAFAWATYVAEVEVDLRTTTARVIDFVAVQEVGKVLNETLARGQIQGGVAQGIGWALLEDVQWREGAMANAQLANYVIPTSADLPPLRVAFLEHAYPYGAQGAKGIGELPMDGPGPAIANAIAAATGTDPRVLPLVPERLMELLAARSRRGGALHGD